jgi:methionyl-tRNA formyltransferase
MQNKLKTAFFGTPEFAVSILDEMKKGGVMPDLIVTNPDEPKGRKLIITPPPVKLWGLENNIPVIQPENLKSTPKELEENFDLFIVAAYGKIIPEVVINLPKYKTINVHPSLLPKYRGASPIQSAILNGDTETGVSIMLLDKEMDHGPVIAQEKVDLSENLYLPELKNKLAKIAGKLILSILPSWISGSLNAVVQNHNEATFTKKIEKEDGFIDPTSILEAELHGTRSENIERMVRALNPDPGVFTFVGIGDRKIRVKITRARVEGDKLIIEKVVPEGKKEMNWDDFKRGHKI